MQNLGEFKYPAVAALGASSGDYRLRRLLSDGEVYEDAPGGWRRLRGLDSYGQALVPIWANIDVATVAGTALSVLGPAVGTNGTNAGGTISSASYRASLLRHQSQTGTATGVLAGPRQTVASRSISTGIDFIVRFALTLLTGHQAMIGLSTSTLNGEPSAIGASIILAADSTDTNLQWATRDGNSSTKIDTGVAKTSTDVLRVRFTVAPNGTSIIVSLYSETTSTVLSAVSLNATLPSASTFLNPMAQVRNGATTTSALIDFIRWWSAAAIG